MAERKYVVHAVVRDHLLNEINEPYHTFVANFWRCLLLDLTGKGVASGDVPSRYRGQSYPERVNIERETLRQEALAFLTDPNFDGWADISGLDAQEMREKLCRLLEP